MLKNNIKIDVKAKCKEECLTQVQLAEKVGTTAPYINRVIRNSNSVVNKTFINMLEQLGYDIEIKYIKKKQTELGE